LVTDVLEEIVTYINRVIKEAFLDDPEDSASFSRILVRNYKF